MQRTTITIFAVLMTAGALLLAPLSLVDMARAEPESIDALLLERVNGPSIWENATELADLGSAYPAFRCAGSAGANASAQWIKSQFESMGLEAWYEEFQFPGWDLRSQPLMEVSYLDGTGQHNLSLGSFQAEHFSFSTSEGGSVGAVEVLPIPLAYSLDAFSGLGFEPSLWQGIDIEGKVVLVGREVRWNAAWESALANKLEEGPAALVFYYSQTWTEGWGEIFSASSGGRPLSSLGSYAYLNQVPIGNLNTSDSAWLLGLLGEGNATARLTIEASSGTWKQCNVVARLPGEGGSDEKLIITAHYDSVMAPGFVDNAVGVAAMLEVASALSWAKEECGYRPERTMLFVAFTGEEMGLVGSNYFYAQHEDEMPDVLALINLDCLGGGTMAHTATEASHGLDLDSLVYRLAQESGLDPELEDGSSDHISFLHPEQVDSLILVRWGESPGLAIDAPSVLGSLSVFSAPLSPTESATYGHAGWIHSSRDSSHDPLINQWVSEEAMEAHTEVVLKAGYEVAGSMGVPPTALDGSTVLIALGVALGAAAVVVIFLLLRRSRAS